MNIKNCHYVNGKWIKGSEQEFSSINPATGTTIWEGNTAGEEVVNEAVSSAKKASLPWRDLGLQKRIKFLEAFQEELTKAKTALSEAISQDTGKPLWETATEVAAMINKISISIEAYHTRCPDTSKELPLGIATTTHRAHGVMAVIGPFNFPGHLPNGHIIPALLAGNTVVFKPSELTPLVAEETLKCWEACNLPNGVINMVQGARETGQLLSHHPDIDGLLFTGSWHTGRHLAEHMAKTPYKILALEMGGNNPLIIGEIKDFKAAAYMTVQSAFLTSGQRCTCARRLIIPKGDKGDHFLNVLIEMIKTIEVGAYTEKKEPFMGPVISIKAAEMLLTAEKTLISSGGISLVGLKQIKKESPFLSPGLIDVTSIKNLPDEEYFGPFLQVIRVDDFSKAIQEANNSRYGLVAGLFSDDPEEYIQFFQSIKAGIINWNTPLTGASSAAPFGGIGQSGNNRPGAYYAADYCAYPVASLSSSRLKLPGTITPGITINPAAS